MWIKRTAVDKILKSVQSRPVTLLTGIRQTGKTSLLKNIFKETEYVTLDRVSIAREAEENPSSFLSSFSGPVIFDEIQYAPSLFRELKILIDEERSVNGRWILTGSQKLSLMKNAGESLAGRIGVLNLETLNTNELKGASLLTDRSPIWKGGFPEIWASGLNTEEFFESYIQTYLERDLRQLTRVVNLRDFQKFITLLVLRIGQLINYSNLAQDIGVSLNTIKSWISILETSGIIFLLPPFFGNIGKRFVKAPKLYFCDTGLASALMNIYTADGYHTSHYSGNLWENYTFLELIKSGLRPGKELFFYRDQNRVEIDFLINKNSRITLIEAKENERVDEKKLNFSKVRPLFKNQRVECYIACGTEEDRVISLRNSNLYNPLKTTIEL